MKSRMYLEIGGKLVRQGDLEGAILVFCQAIEMNPKYSPAYNNLGLVLRTTHRFGEAEACFRRAIELNPDDSYAYNNLGLVLIDLGYMDKAEVCFQRAIELSPGQAEFYSNLGTVLEEQSYIIEAKAAYCQAIKLDPYYSEAYYNMGGILRLTKELDEAEGSLRKALELRPGYLEAELSLSLLHFLRGEYEDYWDSYEKTRLKRWGEKELGIPIWRGEDLTHCSILLFWEYGFGDTMQFVRYAKKVEKLAKQTSLWVQKPLQRLLQTANPSLTVYGTESPPQGQFDFACSFLSLPVIFNTRSETIPQPVSYMLSNQEGVAVWHKILENRDQGNKYRVGVVWAGHPKHLGDGKRSIPFEVFQELFSISSISWISLQVGGRAEELLNISYNVIDFSKELVDFMETAQLIENLDLVITVDSAVAHLAGTMGKKTWILLAFDADWRWQLEREDSPWYPTVRLFRQRKFNDWKEVLARVKTALEELI